MSKTIRVKSLGIRLAVISAAVLFVLMVLVGTSVEHQLRKAIQQQELEQAEIHARTMMASLQTLMLNGSGTLAREWLDRMKGTAGIINIDVLRRNGKPAFRDLNTVNRVNRFLGEIRFHREPSPIPQHAVPEKEHFRKALSGEVSFSFHADTSLTLMLPIPGDTACLACHGYDHGSLRGVLRLSLDTEPTKNRIASMRTALWVMLVLVVMILASALLWILRSNVLQPLGSLRNAISRVADGDREANLPVVRDDELGQVARIFNQMQVALKAGEARIRAVMDNVVDGIVMIDENGIIESVNPAAENLFGYQASELIGENVKKLVPEPHRSAHDGYIQKYLNTGDSQIIGSVREVSGIRKDGTLFPMDLGVSQMQVGDTQYFIGVARDITSRRAQTAALRHQALHDGLTDLPNRSLFYDRLEQSVLMGSREKRQFAVMLIDLNGFKDINDRLGHHFGDLVLQEMAHRLIHTLRESDTVARLGGDEFAVLLPGTNSDFAVNMAKRIIGSLDEPLVLHSQEILLGASIGIALFPQHGEDTMTMMQRADTAMYSAKRAGDDYTVYDPKQVLYKHQNWVQVSDLRDAIDNQELLLHYQPKVDLKSNQIYGVEALLRWNHSKHGLLLPEEFIPLAEQTGLIKPLTLWVLRTALLQWQTWRDKDWEVGIAVNLSVRSLQDAGFIENLQNQLEAYQNTPLRVKLEITETSIMSDPARATYILNRLNNIGVRLSIDDFGIGYSSLSYLKQLPVDELKIDKSFISGMTSHEDSVIIVRSTIDLAHKLGLQVVAEGVESKSTYELLASLGCDAAQGYFISRPLPGDELQDWVTHSGWNRQWLDNAAKTAG